MVSPICEPFGTRPTHPPTLELPKEVATPSRPLAEAIGFFRAWLSDPLRVASVTPSSKALARLITLEISEQTGPVIELGPGTGTFTYALLARGVRPEDLVLVESGPDFAEALQLRFPGIRTLCTDAARLRLVTPFGERPVGAVVSGLPVLSMAPRQVMAILKGSFRQMVPNGAFYQFTYGPRCPVRLEILDRLGLEARRVGRTLANVPPAAVYRISRTAASARAHEDHSAYPSEEGRGPAPGRVASGEPG
jgi:phospholipid N-methyltransferase